MAVPLTSQHPLEKAHVVASSSSPITNNIQDCGAYKHKILELFLDIQFFPEKMLKTNAALWIPKDLAVPITFLNGNFTFYNELQKQQ
jgi:hypothetical protein